MEEAKRGPQPGLDFLPRAFEAMIEYLKGSISAKDPIIDFQPPEDLTKLVSFKLPAEAQDDDTIL